MRSILLKLESTKTTIDHSQPGPKNRVWTTWLFSHWQEIFKENISELLGPYCCAQFAVSRDTIRRHNKDQKLPTSFCQAPNWVMQCLVQETSWNSEMPYFPGFQFSVILKPHGQIKQSSGLLLCCYRKPLESDIGRDRTSTCTCSAWSTVPIILTYVAWREPSAAHNAMASNSCGMWWLGRPVDEIL